MAMLQYRPSQTSPSHKQNAAANATASNETIKLIRKLRWIGMEEEAKQLEHELAEREGATADCVVASPRDTD